MLTFPIKLRLIQEDHIHKIKTYRQETRRDYECKCVQQRQEQWLDLHSKFTYWDKQICMRYNIKQLFYQKAPVQQTRQKEYRNPYDIDYYIQETYYDGMPQFVCNHTKEVTITNLQYCPGFLEEVVLKVNTKKELQDLCEKQNGRYCNFCGDGLTLRGQWNVHKETCIQRLLVTNMRDLSLLMKKQCNLLDRRRNRFCQRYYISEYDEESSVAGMKIRGKQIIVPDVIIDKHQTQKIKNDLMMHILKGLEIGFKFEEIHCSKTIELKNKLIQIHVHNENITGIKIYKYGD